MISVTPDAQQRAHELGVDLSAFKQAQDPDPAAVVHLCDADGLALILPDQPKMRPLRVDFLSPQLEHRRRHGGGRGQDLVRACGVHKNPQMQIIDATAGLGRDAYVLASEGAQLTLLEQHPILAALLKDGLVRAQAAASEAQQRVLKRLEVHYMPAQQWLGSADVVYLDPMFPPRHKSAAVKHDMQVLHRLAAPATDTAELFAWAQQTARKRIVVKRPRHAQPLTDLVPNHQLLGQSNRYDVYL
jgi:16S rRNA (guanine1516-N2)-methyltransferase